MNHDYAATDRNVHNIVDVKQTHISYSISRIRIHNTLKFIFILMSLYMQLLNCRRRRRRIVFAVWIYTHIYIILFINTVLIRLLPKINKTKTIWSMNCCCFFFSKKLFMNGITNTKTKIKIKTKKKIERKMVHQMNDWPNKCVQYV